MASNLGSVRLNNDEITEMQTLGFENPSKYLRWKMGQLSDEDLERIQEQKKKLMESAENSGVNGISEQKDHSKKMMEVHPPTRSIEDAVLITEMKMELERFRKDYENQKGKEVEGFGRVETMVEERFQKMLEMQRQHKLELDHKDLQLAFERKDAELKEVRSELDSLVKKINSIEFIKEHGAAAMNVLAGLTKGITNFKTGGLAGVFTDLANLGAGPKQLSQEDEYNLEMGKNIQAMFTSEEIPNVMLTVALLGQNKPLIEKIPVILNKIIENPEAFSGSDNENTTGDHNSNQ